MKNIYIIIAFVTLLFGSITSCNDFLDEDPRGSLTPDTFFKNAEEVTLALNALNDDVGSAGFLEHLGTDIGNSGRIPLSAAGKFGGYEYFPDTGRVNNTWGGYYTVIRDTNVFLASIEKSSLSDEIKGNAIAQILFYRAFAYLKLVVTFGDVPYWTDGEVGIEEVSLLGKTDYKVILNGMVADLERAISLNLSTDRWNQNEGRPTVWAARMLKAYCHVWLAKDDAVHWASAKAELIEITTKSPHQLNDDYADMYRGGNEFHDEIIFGKIYKADVKGNNIVSSRYRRQSENANSIAAMNESGITTGASQINLRRSFANSYDNNDKRKLYNVWDSQLLEDGTTTATFNWVYISKFQRGPIPTSDPLLSFVEATRESSEPARIFLLSDAYLLLAEADFMINGGSSQVALDAINEVRSIERTGLAPYTALTIEDIRQERGWELVSEGYWGRKKDLVRWGILEATVIGLPAAEIAAGANATAIGYVEAEAAIISAAPVGKYHVLPIPLSEIQQSQDIGGALVQNPLWE